MKSARVVVFIVCLSILSMAGCSKGEADNPTAYSSPDFDACKAVMQSAVDAFNAYDEQKFASYLTPEYAAAEQSKIEQEITQFEMGRSLKVKMAMIDIQPPEMQADGSLEILFTLRITPKGLHSDQNEYCIMQKNAGIWQIATIGDYPPTQTPILTN